MPSGVYLGNDVLPIFVVMKPDTVTPALFRGTGFLIAPNILITCWHCVSGPLESGQRYTVVAKEGSGYAAHFLLDVEQHPLGLDLAIARVDLVPKFGLMLSAEELSPGDDIVTYGYPLTDKVLTDSEHIRFQLNARFLRGYVTQSYYYNHPGFVRTPSYELDIPVPHSLSGAPIIKLKTKEVAGVLFGSLDVCRIEQFPGVDREAGSQQAGIERVASFGLAHYTDSLWSLRGMVTQGKPLREFLGLESKVGERPTEKIGIRERLITQPAEEVTQMPVAIVNLWRWVKEIPATVMPGHEKSRAAAEMEELHRRLEKYESRLTPAQLEKLREWRRTIEELKSMHPDYTDFAT